MLGQHVNAQAKICEIAFPTFEVANYGYQQLQNFNTSNEDEKCSITKTPDDNGMACWTRDLSPNNNSYIHPLIGIDSGQYHLHFILQYRTVSLHIYTIEVTMNFA